MVPLERLAEVSEQPVDDLTVLDQRAVVLAFVDETFVDHTLRVRSTNQIVRLVTTADGELVDLERLRQTSRQLVEHHAAKMNPQLKSILERHPEAERLRIRVCSGAGTRTEKIISAGHATRLLADPDVNYLELVGEPDILDD